MSTIANSPTQFTTYRQIKNWCKTGTINANIFDKTNLLINVSNYEIPHLIYTACKHGHLDIVKYLRNDNINIDYNHALNLACRYGYLYIADYILSLNLIKNINLNWSFTHCCKRYDIQGVNWIIKATNMQSNIQIMAPHILRRLFSRVFYNDFDLCDKIYNIVNTIFENIDINIYFSSAFINDVFNMTLGSGHFEMSKLIYDRYSEFNNFFVNIPTMLFYDFDNKHLAKWYIRNYPKNRICHLLIVLMNKYFNRKLQHKLLIYIIRWFDIKLEDLSTIDRQNIAILTTLIQQINNTDATIKSARV